MILSLVAVLAGPGVFAQRNVTGTVRSASNGTAIGGASVQVKGTSVQEFTDHKGYYEIQLPASATTLVISKAGFESREVVVGRQSVVNVALVEESSMPMLEMMAPPGYSKLQRESYVPATGAARYDMTAHPVYNTEEYEGLEENVFHGVSGKPLSTFSIDVDVASYANLRRFINHGQRPPAEAVRIEEMINYFSYDYPEPANGKPFSVHTEIGVAPWNEKHHLVRIGLQARRIETEYLPPANLVFLIDVSGSMQHPSKLPLVKQSFRLLLDQLRDQDHVSIVTYASGTRVVLEPTSAKEKRKILEAIERLQAGGSTAGAAGLRTAYSLAAVHLNEKGNNRVILATDGDFNVGEASNEAMEKLITEKRKSGIYLTVLGFGMGNLKDAKMEILADKGNGNYAYIDNLNEARKVFVSQMAGTLFTVADDVKMQVEFNPAKVQAWRLIGYENRVLKDEDFNNDRKDAGELGAGHTVTALYEIIPVGVESNFYSIDPLKYQPVKKAEVRTSEEWLTVKVRYKKPGESKSQLSAFVLKAKPVPVSDASTDYRWSAAVAAFGMLLKDSPYAGEMDYNDVLVLARSARGQDEEGYRAEFINLVETQRLLP